MRLADYDQFVGDTDWTKEKPTEERFRIARYGLAAEIGALASALKKKVLHHEAEHWNRSNEEIVEELGDSLWYTTQLASMENGGGLASIVQADFKALVMKIESNADFRNAIRPGAFEQFRADSARIIEQGKTASLDAYQSAAFLTARTREQELLDVCLTRLMLLSTAVMGQQFPSAESGLRDDIPDFVEYRTLGTILWHLSAVASLYNLSLSEVAKANELKIKEISNRTDSPPTALYDRIDGVPEEQQFPLKFEISYISTKRDRLQMFYRGRPLGDELDDNARTDDGYRFHDALHLANIAVLGWSPVMRSLMGLKRKYDPVIDRTEDGARARIVEEAIVKAVHSYAILIAQHEGLSPDEARRRLFTDADQIPYDFLRLVRTFAEDLEVKQSRDWEWRKAIVAGHRLYAQLHKEKQGTVSVDLEKRQVTFSRMVIADVHGPVVDAAIEILRSKSLLSQNLKDRERARTEETAILRILGIKATAENLSQISVSHSDQKQISVKAEGVVQDAIWARSIVGFRSQWAKIGHRWICSAMAIGVPT